MSMLWSQQYIVIIANLSNFMFFKKKGEQECIDRVCYINLIFSCEFELIHSIPFDFFPT